jgi:hypothetical protein
VADGGEIAAAFRALAEDAAQAGESIGTSIARWTGDTADIEDENVARTLAADAENTRTITAIKPDPGNLADGAGGEGAGTGGGTPNRIAELLSGGGGPSGAGDITDAARVPGDAGASDVRSFRGNPEGAAYGQSTWADAQTTMTPDEREALWNYSGENPPGVSDPPDYRDINGFLRGKNPGSPAVSDHIASMDRALSIKPVPEDLEVIRETGTSAFDRPVEMLPGSVQHEPGYLSTALGPDPTFDVTQTKPVLHLDVPAGTPAMYMDGLSQFPSERELLLGHGLSYQVDRVENIGGRWHIYGRIVP